MANVIKGRNAVIEALKSGREIDKLIIGKGTEGSIKKIVGIAKERKIPIHYSDKAGLLRIAGDGAHQGVVALVSDYQYCTVEDILDKAASRGEDPFVILLDGIEDPHNLGAIMRTAEVCGVHGIIIPKRRSAMITDTVAKASAGAVEYVSCAKVSNMAQTIDKLQSAGLWIGACHMGGALYHSQNLKGKIGLVIGSEGSGISRLVLEKCDFTVSIPMKGQITSLNASNAAAVLMCEVVRQRDGE